MKIKINEKIDAETIESLNSGTEIFFFHLEIDEITEYSAEMCKIVSDNSWLNDLDKFSKEALENSVNRTIEKLVDIFKKQDNESISSEFGEFMVSLSAQQALEELDHTIVPLSELWKEKVSGNHGFDFHTLTHTELVAYGEAKYRSGGNSYNSALKQILKFISENKDLGDRFYLINVIGEEPVNKAHNGQKSFAAAFSLNSSDANTILKNILKNENFLTLSNHSSEIYLIGVTHVSK